LDQLALLSFYAAAPLMPHLIASDALSLYHLISKYNK
jgi:hypothetical protein